MRHLWWGYLHKDGSLHAKRFFGIDDICEAEEGNFVVVTVGPFDAKNRKDAMYKLKEELCSS